MRWLYARSGQGRGPGTVARWLNAASAYIHGLGIAPNFLLTLEVRGRRSGQTIAFPLVMVLVDGERYVVSMLGEDAQWVRNVRAAAGRAVLRCGRRQPVVLDEVPPPQRARIIKAFLQRAPGARPHIRVDKDAPLAAFEPVAASIPVFHMRTDRSVSP